MSRVCQSINSGGSARHVDVEFAPGCNGVGISVGQWGARCRINDPIGGLQGVDEDGMSSCTDVGVVGRCCTSESAAESRCIDKSVAASSCTGESETESCCINRRPVES